MSTGIADGDEAARMPQPVAHATRTRILRTLGLGLTGGAAFLFICRDVVHASATVCIAAAAVGVLFGIALGLLEPEPVSPAPPS
jgi:hypothetical protein